MPPVIYQAAADPCSSKASHVYSADALQGYTQSSDQRTAPAYPQPCAGLGSLPSESGGPLYHPEDDEHRYIQRRIRDNPMWTLDRGTGFYVQERLSKKKASLLGSNE